MKPIIMLLTLFTSSLALAFDYKVLEVTTSTPFPTGLESASNNKQAPEMDFVETVFNDNAVKPLLDKTTEMYKEIIEANQAIGGAFYREGLAEINCNKVITQAFSSSKYCSFIVVKSYGWYADIELAFTVKGAIQEDEIPTGTVYFKDGSIITKE